MPIHTHPPTITCGDSRALHVVARRPRTRIPLESNPCHVVRTLAFALALALARAPRICNAASRSTTQSSPSTYPPMKIRSLLAPCTTPSSTPPTSLVSESHGPRSHTLPRCRALRGPRFAACARPLAELGAWTRRLAQHRGYLRDGYLPERGRVVGV
ncbi:hypothetical protein PMIN01_00016 [Paraphaeosphaeria minitans]|uniref:Uncharacterized protein n=1 Tax=Paraphaeosphaeria minitans TaxID=565426 RepID=A0A9P6GRD7_9PLEO|nr:hypothetical protein PMIN01_00016 [Paraphaeosphaeria minitans]